MHLATMLKEIARFDPQVVVVDPLNSFVTVGNEDDVKLMLLRHRVFQSAGASPSTSTPPRAA